MPFFGHKNKPKPPDILHLRHPLNAIPYKANGIKVKKDHQNCLQLLREEANKNSLLGNLANRLKLIKTSRLNLDEMGSYFWGCINGRDDLWTISNNISVHFKQTIENSRKASIVYLKSLMLRHYVYIAVEKALEPKAKG